MVVRERAGGVSVTPQPVVDLEQAKKEREALNKTIDALEKSQAAVRPSPSYVQMRSGGSLSMGSEPSDIADEGGQQEPRVNTNTITAPRSSSSMAGFHEKGYR